MIEVFISFLKIYFLVIILISWVILSILPLTFLMSYLEYTFGFYCMIFFVILMPFQFLLTMFPLILCGVFP